MSFRFKFLPWLLLGIMVIGLVVVGLSMSRITIDLTWGFIALAVILVGWLVYRLTQHVFAPKRAYLIETNVRITDPLIPFVGRHTFHADLVVRDTQKGTSDVVSRKTIKLAFRGKNAAEFRSECMVLLTQALEEQRGSLRQQDPDAEIIVEQSPRELMARLPVIEV